MQNTFLLLITRACRDRYDFMSKGHFKLHWALANARRRVLNPDIACPFPPEMLLDPLCTPALAAFQHLESLVSPLGITKPAATFHKCNYLQFSQAHVPARAQRQSCQLQRWQLLWRHRWRPHSVFMPPYIKTSLKIGFSKGITMPAGNSLMSSLSSEVQFMSGLLLPGDKRIQSMIRRQLGMVHVSSKLSSQGDATGTDANPPLFQSHNRSWAGWQILYYTYFIPASLTLLESSTSVSFPPEKGSWITGSFCRKSICSCFLISGHEVEITIKHYCWIKVGCCTTVYPVTQDIMWSANRFVASQHQLPGFNPELFARSA